MAHALRIIDPGPLTAVQDRGRFGWEHIGVARGGALDFAAYRWVNRLVGNESGAAVLECLLHGPTVATEEEEHIAVVGASEVEVDGVVRPGTGVFSVAAGATVRIGRVGGARCYVAVRGGFDIPPVLGSRSTDLESGFGGYMGRALRAQDLLGIGRHVSGPQPRSGNTIPFRVGGAPLTLRVVPGPQGESFPPGVLDTLLRSRFRISPYSNHIGVRLDGDVLPAAGGGEISQPMPVGAVQVTPSGQPIVLLNSRGTIGGYPVLATLITPDVWRLAQGRPGDGVQFQSVSALAGRAAARDALAALERDLDTWGSYVCD